MASPPARESFPEPEAASGRSGLRRRVLFTPPYCKEG